MTTIYDKFNRAFQSKEAIRQALISKGEDVPTDTPFADYAEKINSISVGNPYYEEFFNGRTNDGTDMSGLFAHYKGKSLSIISNLDTSKATDMSYMFHQCWNQRYLDLSSWDTSNVTNMDGMFSYCWLLEYLDISNFDMSNVTDTSNMFSQCGVLYDIHMENCSRDTISKVISSSDFPTYEDPNIRKEIHVRGASVAGLTPPKNWYFDYIYTPYVESVQTLAINEEVEQEVIEEQEQMIINEEETYYDPDNENLMI